MNTQHHLPPCFWHPSPVLIATTGGSEFTPYIVVSEQRRAESEPYLTADCAWSGRNWLCNAPFYRDGRYFCRIQFQKVLLRSMWTGGFSSPAKLCVHADKEQLHGRQSGAVTPSLCQPSCSPPSLRAKQGPTNCASSFSVPLPDSMAGQAMSSQASSTPPGRPKNISHVPTRHGF